MPGRPVIQGFNTDGVIDAAYVSGVGGGPFYNVKFYGAVGDGVADDTAAIQAAIDAMTGLDGGILYFPPGFYLVTDTLLFGQHSGYVVQGSGSQMDDLPGWNGAFLGSCIVASGMGAKPVLDFYGSAAFSVRDLAIYGNTTATLVGAAKFGIRVRTFAGYGSGTGVFQNVTVHWCATGIEAGDSSDTPTNAGDLTFVRCMVNNCTTGFHNSFVEALNYGFYDFLAFGCDDVFSLEGGSFYASLFGSYNCQRIVVVKASGPNLGHVTMVNLRLDGTAYRTIVYETDAAADGSTTIATFIDVCCITGQPASGTSRFILRGKHLCKLIGGRGLCGAGGTLFDLGAGNASILVTGAELPNNESQVAGTVVVGSKYRIRDCFDATTHLFLADYSNDGTGATVTKVMTADQSISSSTTLTDVTELAWPIGPNETLAIQFSINAGNSNTITGHDFSLTTPAGATMWMQGTALESGDNPGSSPQNGRITSSGARLTLNAAGDANIINLTAYVANGATPGNVQLQFAQSTSDPTDLTFKKGSFGVAHRA